MAIGKRVPLPSETTGDGPTGRTMRHPVRPESTALARRLAACAAAALLIVGAGATPFAAVSLVPIPGYMAAFGAAMIVINILLAALLFSKGALEDSGDATRLGTAYLFVAVIFVPLVASFPGAIMATPLIGTPISAIWLWTFWHTGFGLCIIRYAWRALRRTAPASLPAEILGVVVAVGVLTIIATVAVSTLPPTLTDGHTIFGGVTGAIPLLILAIIAIALVLIVRNETLKLEQISLAVGMVAALVDVWLTYKGAARFTVGWYVSKLGSLVTSLTVLVILLYEVTLLHRRAAKANTELERLAQKLTVARDQSERASVAKSRFLAGMSHELRTPLNGILGYAQLLHLEGDLNARQSARVDAMLGAGKHLIQMITSVLSLSEIEAEHVELVQEELDMRVFAEACLDLVRPPAQAKALALNLVVAPGTALDFTTDPTRLRQVVLNLLGNAVKFTRHGAIILRLQPGKDGAFIRIEVADTGTGIPAAQSKRLFHEFERLDTAETRAAEGAGLGLALSARLVALMGGTLGHTDNPGGGSVFWVELPYTSQPALAARQPETSQPPLKPPVRPLRILVVDDMLMNRDIAEAFLRAGGHDVTCAAGGTEAIAAIARTGFDLILMDVRMPQMDGLEATRHIRALDGPRGTVPIVALTAQAFTDQVDTCRKAGMDSHLAKPFDKTKLLATVADTMAAHTPKQTAPDPGLPLGDAELLVLDRAALERMTALLKPEATAADLRLIAEDGTQLQSALRAPNALAAQTLADAAHALAGRAGVFGFQRLAAVGRSFERAVQTGSAETPALADRLCTAVEVTCQEIWKRLPEVAA